MSRRNPTHPRGCAILLRTAHHGKDHSLGRVCEGIGHNGLTITVAAVRTLTWINEIRQVTIHEATARRSTCGGPRSSFIAVSSGFCRRDKPGRLTIGQQLKSAQNAGSSISAMPASGR